nr:MAG TPA: hypothetical protein [Caudoviricetes sp.]
MNGNLEALKELFTMNGILIKSESEKNFLEFLYEEITDSNYDFILNKQDKTFILIDLEINNDREKYDLKSLIKIFVEQVDNRVCEAEEYKEDDLNLFVLKQLNFIKEGYRILYEILDNERK